MEDTVKTFVLDALNEKKSAYCFYISADDYVDSKEIRYMWNYFTATSKIYSNTYNMRNKMLFWVSDRMDEYKPEEDRRLLVEYCGSRDNIIKYDKYNFQMIFTGHTLSPVSLIRYDFPDGASLIQVHNNPLWKKVYDDEEDILKKFIIYKGMPFWTFNLTIEDPVTGLNGRTLVTVYNFQDDTDEKIDQETLSTDGDSPE